MEIALFTKMRGSFALMLAATAVGAAVVALPAIGQAPQSDSAIAAPVSAAFPYVRQVAPHAPAVRLAVDDAQVIAEGAVGSGSGVVLQVTRSGSVCAVYDGTSTCAPADKAAESGIFIGVISCSGPQAGTASVVGVAPQGVEQVDSDAGRQATGPNGSVKFTVAGGRLTGIHLDNGHVAPLMLDPGMCDHRSIVKPGN